MTAPPDPVRTHTWDGSGLPDWLRLDDYHFDNDQLIVHTPDGDTRPQPGWLIVQWSDGTVTCCSPTLAARVYGVDGLVGRLARVREAAALHRQGLLTTAELYAVIGPTPGPP